MTPRQELDALIDTFAPQIRAAFMAAIADVVDNTIINEVIKAIQNGDPAQAFRALGMSDASMLPITKAIEEAFETGGVMTGATFPKYLNTFSGKAVFRFNVRNSRAEAFLRDKSSSLITSITEDARVNVQTVLQAGMREGVNPRTVALDIVGRIDQQTGKRVGGIIGLSQNQVGWVESTRNKLVNLDSSYFKMGLRDKRFDGMVEKAIRTGTPLPKETVDKLVLRYKTKALKWRGDNIGRTEAMQALNAAEYEATLQAVESGATTESAVQREWDDAGDTRVRYTHHKMNKQRVGLHEPFVSPSGARMMHPGDTSLGAGADEVAGCRCRVRTVIDWSADLD